MRSQAPRAACGSALPSPTPTKPLRGQVCVSSPLRRRGEEGRTGMKRAEVLATLAMLLVAAPATAKPIDRHALVTRHNIELTQVDPHAPLMLGNGSLGFTADITGLQTFPEEYSPLAPLLTMAQWAWHSFPNPAGYSEADGQVMVAVPGRGEQPYPWIRDWAELDTNPALKWLRENPHRFSLGRIALVLKKADGAPAAFADLGDTRQTLDLWTGTLTSRFVLEGRPVTVETRVRADRDAVLVSVRSPLVAMGRIAIDVRHPGVSPDLNPDPSDWAPGNRPRPLVLNHQGHGFIAEHFVDEYAYYSTLFC